MAKKRKNRSASKATRKELERRLESFHKAELDRKSITYKRYPLTPANPAHLGQKLVSDCKITSKSLESFNPSDYLLNN